MDTMARSQRKKKSGWRKRVMLPTLRIRLRMVFVDECVAVGGGVERIGDGG